MSLLDRLGLRRRKGDSRLYNLLSGQLAADLGVRSSPLFPDGNASMKVAVVYACVNLISGAIAQMPLRITVDGPAGPRPARKMVERLVNRSPSPLYTGPTFMEWIVHRILLHGNAYVAILRDAGGSVSELLPFDSEHVNVERRDGRMRYHLGTSDAATGTPLVIDQSEMLHFVNSGEMHGGRALSVIEQGAGRAVRLESSMEDYVTRFWQKGALQQFVIKHTARWNEEQRSRLRQSWADVYGQGVDGAFAPLVIDSTADVTPLNLNARDTQLLESRDFQIDDIARAFRVPSYLVNREAKTTSFGSGVSEISRSFLKFTLAPHIRRIEAELDRKLFPRTGESCRFDTTVLTRASTAERYTAYRTALGGGSSAGFMSVNEVRALEGMPPVEGDEYDKPHAAKGGGGMMPPPGIGPPPDESGGGDEEDE